MPFLFQVHDKSGTLSHSRSYIFNPQTLSPGNPKTIKMYRFRKEHISLTEGERAWNIPFLHCFSRKMPGSMTIEASLGLTVFLVFMVSLSQLFLVMQLQLRMQKALEQVGNEVAQYCYLNSQVRLWESESKLLEELKEYLLAELSEEAIRIRFMELLGPETLSHSVLAEGEQGISFEESRLLREHHRLRLVVSYPIRLPVRLWGMGDIILRQQCYRYARMGDVVPAKKVETTERMVYVTRNGQVYHVTLSCTYLNLSVRSVSMSQVEDLRNANGGKYYACERCEPGGWEEAVYVTEDGDRFHGKWDCAGLRRYITSVPMSQVKDLRPCSRCGREE